MTSRPHNWLVEHQTYPYDDWCLIWPFHRNKNGRAIINAVEDSQFAYRVMCRMVHGDPPTPEHTAAHSCGNGHLGCVSPRHISWKTQSENMEDCEAKGTRPKHRLGPRGHFSQHEVERIRFLLQTHTQLEVAQMYMVTESTICDIKRGRYYARPPKLNYWTPEEDAKIKDCVERGLNFTEIAKELGRSVGATMGRTYRIGLKSGVPPIPKKAG